MGPIRIRDTRHKQRTWIQASIMLRSPFHKTTLISTNITTAGALRGSDGLSEKDIKQGAKRKATNGLSRNLEPNVCF